MTISKLHDSHPKEICNSLWCTPFISIGVNGVNAHQALIHFNPVKRDHKALTPFSVNALNHSVTDLKPVYGSTTYKRVINPRNGNLVDVTITGGF